MLSNDLEVVTVAPAIFTSKRPVHPSEPGDAIADDAMHREAYCQSSRFTRGVLHRSMAPASDFFGKRLQNLRLHTGTMCARSEHVEHAVSVYFLTLL